MSLAVNANNRITTTGYAYDLAGNMTTIAGISGSLVYNAENQLTSAAGVTYYYDGDGRRVRKNQGGKTGTYKQLYWYGLGGEVLQETNDTGGLLDEYVFFNGSRTARRNSTGTVYYYFGDHLGSSRVIVQAGATAACYEADYYPFGGERVIANTCSQNYKFTGKQRDPESNLDFFGARYYASTTSRYLSPDWSSSPSPVPYADFANPQSLNLYTYVGNNPLNATDPDGHCCAFSASSISDFIDSGVNRAVEYVREKAVSSGNPTAAGAATFLAGSTGDVAKGFTNLLRTGESIGSLPENASSSQVVTALAEEGGRVGGTILVVVAVAGPRTPATSEQGAQVAGEIGKNRVTLDNGSVVDLSGKAHFEKATQQSVPTPQIKDATYHTGPTSKTSVTYGPTRPATVGDVNAAARAAGAKPPVTIPKPLTVPRHEKEKERQ